MKTIYLVSSGDYSDYQVWCAFTTQKLADEYVAAIEKADGARNDYSPYVEERQLWNKVPVVSAADITSRIVP